jgi:hypothetical protein
MVRKLKPMKNISLRRKGYILVTDDLTFPIHTVGDVTLQKAKVDFVKSKKLPKLKPLLATKAQLEEMLTLGYDLKDNRVTVKEWDKDSNEFMDFMVESEMIEKYMELAVNIDLLYPMEENLLLWEALELKDSKDYVGVCKFIAGLDLDARYATALLGTIIGIRNSNCRTYEEYEQQLEEELEKAKKEEV